MRVLKSEHHEWPRIPEEPEGWRDLQARAKNERDPRKLEAIIAEMNELLTECDRRTAAKQVLGRLRGRPKPISVRE